MLMKKGLIGENPYIITIRNQIVHPIYSNRTGKSTRNKAVFFSATE
jgi:hypothetical protein